MNIVPVAFAFDNKLIFPACVCLSSLMMNANDSTFYHIHIIHPSKEEFNKIELDKIPHYYHNCKITYLTAPDYFDQSFEIRGITSAAYYRLMIPDLIHNYDKIIYSDVDVIFRSDLSEIYNSTNIGDNYFAGVNSLAHLNEAYNKYYKTLSLDPSRIIYSGNLIINSKKIIEDRLIEKFKQHAKMKYKFQDMDIINICCENKIMYLNPGFCLSTYICEWATRNRKKLTNIWSDNEIDNALSEGIVHYNGNKPWEKYCINFDIWWEYYRKCPFFDHKFYFEFFNGKLNELDTLSLWDRIKLVLRFFYHGKTC